MSELQQQAPPFSVAQQAYSTHSGHGSVGPLIAVLAVIIILGVIAGMIGRICFGKTIMGHGQYDMEGWVERKFSSCIDGRIEIPTNHTNSSVNSVPVVIPVENPEEIKKTKQSAQNPSVITGS